MSIRDFHAALEGPSHTPARIGALGQLRSFEDLPGLLRASDSTQGWPKWFTDTGVD